MADLRQRCTAVHPERAAKGAEARCTAFQDHAGPHELRDGLHWTTEAPEPVDVWQLAEELEGRGWVQSVLPIDGVLPNGIAYVHGETGVGLVITVGQDVRSWFVSVFFASHRIAGHVDLSLAVDALEALAKKAPRLPRAEGRTFEVVGGS